MKLKEKFRRVPKGFRQRVRKRVADERRERLLAKGNPFLSGIYNFGDGVERILSTGDLQENSVLAMCDLDPETFTLTPQGKIGIAGQDGQTVAEQNIDGDHITFQARRLDDAIVYQIDGKGNNLGTGVEVVQEFEARTISEEFRPDQPVVVEIHTTTDSTSGGEGQTTGSYAVVRENGALELHCTTDGSVITEGMASTGITLKKDPDMQTISWETPHLSIKAYKEGDLIEYSVTGKKSDTPLAKDTYVEMTAGGIAAPWCPLATGPVIILRTANDDTDAVVEINQDGSVKLYVAVDNCVFDPNKPVTCTYLNIVEEGVVTYTQSSDQCMFYARKQDNTIFYGFKNKKSSGTCVAGDGVLEIWTGNLVIGHEEFLPDETVGVEITDMPGLVLIITPDKGAVLINTTSSAITNVAMGEIQSCGCMKIDQDTDEQRLEADKISVVARADDNNVITYEVQATADGTTIAASLDKELMPPGTIDYEFTPSAPDGSIIVPLKDNAGKETQAVCEIKPDGSVQLINESSSQVTVGTIPSNVAYGDPEASETIEQKVEGKNLEVGVYTEGDIVIYEAQALTDGTITTHEEFPAGTIKEELIPKEPVVIELPCKDGANAAHGFVTINTDGSVSMSAAKLLDTDASGSACEWSQVATGVVEKVAHGQNMDLVVAKSEDGIATFTIEPTNSPNSGTYADDIPSGQLPSDFCPDHKMAVEIITQGSSIASEKVVAVIDTDGSVDLITDGSSINTNARNTIMDVDENMTAQGCDKEDFENTTLGVTLTATKVGSLCTYEVVGDSSVGTTFTAGETEILPAGEILHAFLPEEPIFVSARMGTDGEDGGAALRIDTDGSATLVVDTASTGKVLSEIPQPTPCGLVWDEEVEEEEIDITSLLDSYNPETGKSATGDKAFLRLRTAGGAVTRMMIEGKGTIKPGTITGQIDDKYLPKFSSTSGENKVKFPFWTKGSARFTCEIDGDTGNFATKRFSGSGSGTLLGLGKFCAMPACVREHNADIFTRAHAHHTTEFMQSGKPIPSYSLMGTGMMFYHNDVQHHEQGRVLITLGTYRKLVGKEGFGGLKDFFCKAVSWVKSNVDFKAIGNTLLKAGGTIVSGLVSGKGLASSISGAFKEAAAGGIGQFFKPDSPIASIIPAGNGTGGTFGAIANNVVGGVMQMFPSGASSIISKAGNMLANKFPAASSWISKASSFFGFKSEVGYSALPHSSQVIDDMIFVEAIRRDMTVVYHLGGKTHMVSAGTHRLGDELKHSLRPDHDLIIFLSPKANVIIYRDGKIELVAKEEHETSNLVVPATTFLSPNLNIVDGYNQSRVLSIPAKANVKSTLKVTRKGRKTEK